MTPTILTITIDRAAATRAGYAEAGELRVELTDELLAELTESEREQMARHLAGEKYWSPSLTDDAKPLVCWAGAETLRSLLAQRHLLDEQRRQDRAANIRAQIEEVLAAPPRERATVGLTTDGELVVNGGYCIDRVTRVDLPVVPSVYDADACGDPELLALYHAARELAEEARAAAIEACRPDLEALRDDRLAQESARLAAWDALYARLPATLRARHQDGYATDVEVERAMRRLLARDHAGPDCGHQGYSGFKELDALSDAEYEQMVAVRERAVPGATIEALELWDYRPADYDDGEVGDDDGEVIDEDTRRRVIRETWTDASGIKVQVYTPIV